MKRARIQVEDSRWGEVVAFTSVKNSLERREFGFVPDHKSNSTDEAFSRDKSGAKSHHETNGLISNKDVHPRMIDRKLQATLGRHLRVMFDDVARSPVPDKFLELLQNLDAKEKEQPE